jgi:transcriptional regulator with XRE-family HTH domain
MLVIVRVPLAFVKMTEDHAVMGARAVMKGPMASVVAENVRQLRLQRGLTQQELADRLTGLGRPMAGTGVAKVEGQARRMDVDDLVAFAAALDVGPSRLLMPEPADGSVELLPSRHTSVLGAWLWLSGLAPLAETSARGSSAAFDLGQPSWLRELAESPLVSSAWDLARRAVLAVSGPVSNPLAARDVRIALERMALELERFEEDPRSGAHPEAGPQ